MDDPYADFFTPKPVAAPKDDPYKDFFTPKPAQTFTVADPAAPPQPKPDHDALIGGLAQSYYQSLPKMKDSGPPSLPMLKEWLTKDQYLAGPTVPGFEKAVSEYEKKTGQPVNRDSIVKDLHDSLTSKRFAAMVEEDKAKGDSPLRGENIVRKVPFMSYLQDWLREGDARVASERLQKGEASNADLYALAKQVSRGMKEEEKGTGRRAYELASSIPTYLLEWAAMSGGAGVAALSGKAAAAGSLGSKGAIRGLEGLARTASPAGLAQIGGTAAIPATDRVSGYGEDGIQIEQGKGLGESLARAAASKVANNLLNTMIAVPGMPSGFKAGVKGAAKGTAAQAASMTASEQADSLSGIGPHKTTIARMIAGDEKAFADFAIMLATFGTIEGVTRATSAGAARQQEMVKQGFKPDSPAVQQAVQDVIADHAAEFKKNFDKLYEEMAPKILMKYPEVTPEQVTERVLADLVAQTQKSPQEKQAFDDILGRTEATLKAQSDQRATQDGGRALMDELGIGNRDSATLTPLDAPPGPKANLPKAQAKPIPPKVVEKELDASPMGPKPTVVHSGQKQVREKMSEWLTDPKGEHSRMYPENAVIDPFLEEAIQTGKLPPAAPLPKGAESIPGFQDAWDIVTRLWPEPVSEIKKVVVSKEIKRAGLSENGTLYIGEGVKVTPDALWHEFVHAEQKQQGRFIPAKERTEAQHAEMERESSARQGQFLRSGLADKLKAEPAPDLTNYKAMLEAVGVSTKKMKPAEIVAEVKRLGLDRAVPKEELKAPEAAGPLYPPLPEAEAATPPVDKSLTPVQQREDAVLKDRQGGLSLRKLAEKYGISHEQVRLDEKAALARQGVEQSIATQKRKESQAVLRDEAPINKLRGETDIGEIGGRRDRDPARDAEDVRQDQFVKLTEAIREGDRKTADAIIKKMNLDPAMFEEHFKEMEMDNDLQPRQETQRPSGLKNRAGRRGSGEAPPVGEEAEGNLGRRVGEEGRGEEGIDPAVLTEPMESKSPFSSTKDLNVTGVKNELIATERERMGLNPVAKTIRKSNPELWEKVVAEATTDPMAPERLMESLRREPGRAVKDEEVAMLAYRKVQLMNELDNAMLRQADAYNTGAGAAELKAADAAVDAALKANEEIGQISKKIGATTARALQIRTILADEQYSLQRMLAQARAAKGKPLTEEERKEILALQKTIDELRKELAKGFKDMADRRKAQFGEVTAIRKYEDMLGGMRDSNRSTGRKVFDSVSEVLSLARSIFVGLDLPPVFRQGGLFTLAHPIKSAKALKETIGAGRSEERAHAKHMEIEDRENHVNGNYERMGMEFTGEYGGLSQREESFRSKTIGKIPGFAHLERSHVAYLNRIRADLADTLLATLPKDLHANEMEMRAIGNFVNSSTGRGNMGQFRPAVPLLSHIFLAPRYVVSRFQMALSPFTNSALGVSGHQRAARKAVAREQVRIAMGLGVIYGLAKIAQEEGLLDLEADPRSSDFGKIKIGNTRYDPMAGVQQGLVLVSRLVSGETKTGSGQVKDIRGEGVKFGQDDAFDVAAQFGRTKLSPLVGAAADVTAGKNVISEPVKPSDAAKKLITPLSAQEIYQISKEFDVPKDIISSLLILFGMGVQEYSPKKK